MYSVYGRYLRLYTSKELSMKNFRGVQRLDQVQNLRTRERFPVLAYMHEDMLFVQETEVLTPLDLMPKGGWLRQVGHNLADIDLSDLKTDDILKRESKEAGGEYRVDAITRNGVGGVALVVVTRSMIITDPENWGRIVSL